MQTEMGQGMTLKRGSTHETAMLTAEMVGGTTLLNELIALEAHDLEVPSDL